MAIPQYRRSRSDEINTADGRGLRLTADGSPLPDVEGFLARHGVAILKTARSHSARAEDADDAYQRAVEILLQKAPDTRDERELLAWTLTVVRNEALTIRRRDSLAAVTAPEEFERIVAAPEESPEQRLLHGETVERGRDAMRRIKLDQLRCLLLKAEGLDYETICEQTGFSYAKVNRLLSEGRASLRDRYERLESGAVCRSLSGRLSMIADGTADEKSTHEARLHLKTCVSCRATVRAYRLAPKQLAGALPLAVAANEAGGGLFGRLATAVRQAVESVQSAAMSLQERFGSTVAAYQGAELATAKKLAVAAALSASLVAGGVTAERALDGDGGANAGRHGATAGQVGSAVPSAGSDDVSEDTGDGGETERRREKRHRPREVRASDVAGASAGAQVEGTGEAPRAVGDSTGVTQVYDSPAQRLPDSGSSSEQTDLAP